MGLFGVAGRLAGKFGRSVVSGAKTVGSKLKDAVSGIPKPVRTAASVGLLLVPGGAVARGAGVAAKAGSRSLPKAVAGARSLGSKLKSFFSTPVGKAAGATVAVGAAVGVGGTLAGKGIENFGNGVEAGTGIPFVLIAVVAAVVLFLVMRKG